MTTPTAKADLQNSRRVLVYDDDEVLLDLLGTVLIREGYEIETTLCAQEGRRLISTQSFDAAIVDLGLRRTSGYGLVREIREVSPKTAILAVSAYPSGNSSRHSATGESIPATLHPTAERQRGALQMPSIGSSTEPFGGTLGAPAVELVPGAPARYADLRRQLTRLTDPPHRE